MDEQSSLKESSTQPAKRYKSKRQKRNQMLVMLSVIVSLLVIGYLGYFIATYKAPTPSSYATLAYEHYDQNGLDYSFDYPRLMSENASIAKKLPSTPVAYSYYQNGTLQAVIGVSYENISNPLHFFNLTPAQYLHQLTVGKGSYIDSLNIEQRTNDSYEKDFPGCTKSVITNSHQTTLLCVNRPTGYLNARLIGVTKKYQYTLEMEMQPSLWAAHQKVWQEIEKSFSFQ